MESAAKGLTCKLTTPELQWRRATVIQELKSLLLSKEPAPDGLKFTFSGSDEVLGKLFDFIRFERLCCDFLIFSLSIAGEHAILEITGPAGTQNFLEHEVGF